MEDNGREVMVVLPGERATSLMVSQFGGLDVQDGHLICRDTKGWMVASFAPGAWVRAVITLELSPHKEVEDEQQ